MLTVEISYLVRQEYYKDMQRDIMRQELVQNAELQPGIGLVSLRKMAGWLGTHMVAWGSKLQHQEQFQHQTLSH